MVIGLKMVQPVNGELNRLNRLGIGQPVTLSRLRTGQRVKKSSLFSRRVALPVKGISLSFDGIPLLVEVRPFLVEVRTNPNSHLSEH